MYVKNMTGNATQLYVLPQAVKQYSQPRFHQVLEAQHLARQKYSTRVSGDSTINFGFIFTCHPNLVMYHVAICVDTEPNDVADPVANRTYTNAQEHVIIDVALQVLCRWSAL